MSTTTPEVATVRLLTHLAQCHKRVTIEGVPEETGFFFAVGYDGDLTLRRDLTEAIAEVADWACQDHRDTCDGWIVVELGVRIKCDQTLCHTTEREERP